MNIKKMIIAVVLIIAMALPQVAFATPTNATEAKKVSDDDSLSGFARAKKGWVKESGNLRYYLTNTSYVKNAWKEINKNWFYFDKNGFVATGWQKIKGKTYFLSRVSAAGKRGRMLTGWNSIDGFKYYFGSDGALVATGWKQIGGKWFYFTVSSKLGESGKMLTGWREIGGQIYYFKNAGGNGVKGGMFTGWKTIGKYNYYFDGSGKILTGWQKLNGSWYFLKKAITPGIAGRAFTGWQKIGSETYFLKRAGALKAKGKMLTGWQKIDGNTFYFDGNGARKSGWLKIGNDWYYLKPSGANGDIGKRLTGWQTVKNVKYYMSKKTGKMLVGWQVIDGKDCYFDSNGAYDSKKEKGKKLVCIDAGHQRYANNELEPIGPGATTKKKKVSSGTYGEWSKTWEYVLNLDVSKKLEKELKKRGYDVYMIRTTHDVNISNSQRAKNAANAGADIFVRIHANSIDNSSVHGALTMAPTTSNRYLTQKNIAESRRLSTEVVNAFCKATGAYNRGVTNHDDMSGINWCTIPVTIVEMGFMSNRNDDLKLVQNAYQDKMVQGIANGIDNYFK